VQQFLNVLLYLILAITSLVLIFLVLIQRGKGGGLAGAFGGAGGSSAFGTKAGDFFTRVTMITAGIWIALNMILVVVSNRRTSAWGTTSSASSKSSEVVPPIPVPAKPGTGGESIELPANPFAPKEEKGKTEEPTVKPSAESPKVPEALPAEPKSAPK
jgi:preprotein translocase subunit SecG